MALSDQLVLVALEGPRADDDLAHRMPPMLRRYATWSSWIQWPASRACTWCAGWDLRRPYTAGQSRQVSLYQRG